MHASVVVDIRGSSWISLELPYVSQSPTWRLMGPTGYPDPQLIAAKANGKRLGRPKGALGKSKLDGKEREIELLLRKHVSKASFARIVEVSPTTLQHFIHTRKLQPRPGTRR